MMKMVTIMLMILMLYIYICEDMVTLMIMMMVKMMNSVMVMSMMMLLMMMVMMMMLMVTLMVVVKEVDGSMVSPRPRTSLAVSKTRYNSMFLETSGVIVIALIPCRFFLTLCRLETSVSETH